MPRRDIQDYDVSRFRDFVEPLLKQRDESYRQASMEARLDETAISRYFRGTQPMRDACIALADHFGVNPNEMLQAAGYEPLHFFDRQEVDLSNVKPETRRIVQKLEQISDPDARAQLSEAINTLLDNQLRAEAVVAGKELTSGVLEEASNDQIVDWVLKPDVSDQLREIVAHWLLEMRYPDARIVALGRRWLVEGIQEDRPPLIRAGALLADGASAEELEAVRKVGQSEWPISYLLLAWRMGRREPVLEFLKERLSVDMLWDLVKLVASEKYQPALPILLTHYLKGQGWILDAGLNRFDPDMIDDSLRSLLGTGAWSITTSLINRLWKLGTPGAVRQALDAVKDVADVRFANLPKTHRDAVWPMLADFLDDTSRDEFIRWHIFGALRSLWPVDEEWPWEVTAYFFQKLEDPDPDIAREVWRILVSPYSQRSIEEHPRDYSIGLRKLALEGTQRQQRVALRWVASMPEYLRHTLEDQELADLLMLEEVQHEALLVIAYQERRDLLNNVRALANELESEAEAIRQRAVRQGALSENSQQRLREIKKVQQSIAVALSHLGDAQPLLELAQTEGLPRWSLETALDAQGALRGDSEEMSISYTKKRSLLEAWPYRSEVGQESS